MSLTSSTETHVHILVAVWGEEYINDFLHLGLLSLLAPGNIPALAKTYKTTFVLLTRSHDINVFEQHPAFQKLKSICDIQFITINDLIVVGNHSTTLTLAFDRAVRQTGEAMLNTYFVFLTSDYIMADGSLEGLMRYMKKGYSAICAGNFQVLQNEIKPFLKRHVDPVNQVLQIKPRELLKKSFEHLHPVAVASFYNEGYIHNYRSNRFFLHYDHNILAGRFYLLHMLCIKPETTKYQVGASCDYSFIPEMCPSGNITIINDSDDYLVIEIQPKKHELQYVQLGPYHLKKLIASLGEWTTKQHRENAKHTIYYHTNDILPKTKIIIDEKLNQFTDQIALGLQKFNVQPYRNHPYWLGAVDSFNEIKTIVKENDISHYFDLSSLDYATKLRKLINRYFGYPPSVFRWHYRWLEHQSTKAAIQKFVACQNPDTVISLYDSYQLLFIQYCSWLKKDLKMEHHYHLQNLICTKSLFQNLQVKQFERCIIFIKLSNIKKIKKYLTIIKSILSPDGKVLIFIPNHKNDSPNFSYDFQKAFSFKMNHLSRADYHIIDINTIHDNFSLLGSMTVNRINTQFDYSKKWRFLSFFLIGIPGTLITYIRNSLIRTFTSKKGHCTNILVTLDPNNPVVEP